MQSNKIFQETQNKLFASTKIAINVLSILQK